jgi:hypothetical protein
MEKVTVIVGFPIISKLVRGCTVELSELILIPDDQLFNESKNMGCCVQFKKPTAEERGVAALQTTNSSSPKLPTVEQFRAWVESIKSCHWQDVYDFFSGNFRH